MNSLSFASVDLIDKCYSILCNVGQHHAICWGWRQNRKEEDIRYSLFWSWEIHLLLTLVGCQDFRYSGLQTLHLPQIIHSLPSTSSGVWHETQSQNVNSLRFLDIPAWPSHTPALLVLQLANANLMISQLPRSQPVRLIIPSHLSCCVCGFCFSEEPGCNRC